MNLKIQNYDLFDNAKIKIELEFIRKPCFTPFYERIKTNLKNWFSEFQTNQIIMNINTLHPKSTIYISNNIFLKFFETSDNGKFDNSTNFINETHLKFYLSIFEKEKKDILITQFNSIKQKKSESDQYPICLILLENSTEMKFEEIEDFIFKISCDNTHHLEYFKRSLNEIIQKLITYFISISWTQILKLSSLANNNTDSYSKIQFNLAKLKAERFLLLGDYHKAIMSYQSLGDLCKQYTENSLLIPKALEGLALSILLKEIYVSNFSSGKVFMNNAEIENIFNDAAEKLKKFKNIDSHIILNIKILQYHSLFIGKKGVIIELTNQILEDCERISKKMKYWVFIKLFYIFKEIRMKRKSSFYLYLGGLFINETREMDLFLPFILEELQIIHNVVDSSKIKIDNLIDFTNYHKEIKRKGWKDNIFQVLNQKLEPIKTIYKKRVDKNHFLSVTSRNEKLKTISLNFQWGNIQFYLFRFALSFSARTQNLKKKISMNVSFLQTLNNFLSEHDQALIINSIKNDSELVQETVFVNLNKCPILCTLKPIQNKIKFEEKKFENSTTNSNDKIFLYNPWFNSEKKCLYWTVGTIQSVEIEVFNPLLRDLPLNKIILITEGVENFCYPINVIIQPRSHQVIICKFKPQTEGMMNILGIKYEVWGIGGIQYADSLGNGLFYSLHNQNHQFNLRDIKIYPKIATIQALISNIDNSTNQILELFESQNFTFNLKLENNGTCTIKSFKLFIFGYKNEDFKQIISELDYIDLNIQPQSTYHIAYEYLHNKKNKKIEFKFLYKANIEEDNACPYYSIIVKLKTNKILEFSNELIFPLTNNNTLYELSNLDKRLKSDFKKYFISDSSVLSLNIKNVSQVNLFLKIMKDQTILQSQNISKNEAKDISLIFPNFLEYLDLNFCWTGDTSNIIDGAIKLNEFFKKVIDFPINTFKFEITKKFKMNEDLNLGEFQIDYKIINISENEFQDLNIHIYVWKFKNNELIFNSGLKDLVFFDGVLSHEKLNLKKKESISSQLNVMTFEKQNIYTSLLVEDPLNKVIYLSNISENMYFF